MPTACSGVYPKPGSRARGTWSSLLLAEQPGTDSLVSQSKSLRCARESARILLPAGIPSQCKRTRTGQVAAR